MKSQEQLSWANPTGQDCCFVGQGYEDESSPIWWARAFQGSWLLKDVRSIEHGSCRVVSEKGRNHSFEESKWEKRWEEEETKKVPFGQQLGPGSSYAGPEGFCWWNPSGPVPQIHFQKHMGHVQTLKVQGLWTRYSRLHNLFLVFAWSSLLNS